MSGNYLSKKRLVDGAQDQAENEKLYTGRNSSVSSMSDRDRKHFLDASEDDVAVGEGAAQSLPQAFSHLRCIG